jgi:CheY-like chemotaxis protein
MGGEIGVDSNPGIGSTFWFTARFGKQPPNALAQLAPPPLELDGVRALIVDDNETSREILITRISSWGMRPAAEGNGKRALDMLQQAVRDLDPFRVAVVDMQMPEIDGAELGRMIRADARLADTKLIMLTSLGRGEMPGASRKSGSPAMPPSRYSNWNCGTSSPSSFPEKAARGPHRDPSPPATLPANPPKPSRDARRAF